MENPDDFDINQCPEVNDKDALKGKWNFEIPAFI